jgi:NAD-dependent dihydropyrimidine dehydrogenase PreA subunit
MNRVSRRALVNFIVDSAIAAAFLVSAVSGLVFLVPGGWLSLTGSATTALGVSFATWRTVHDWSAVIMIAGVVLHTALHWRWVTTMVRRLAGGGRAQARSAASATPATAGGLAAVSTPAAPVERSSLTRHAFFKRAGAVAAAAVVGGLVGRSVAGAFLQDGTSTSAGVATQTSADDGSLGGTDTDASSGGWGDQSQQTQTQAARVVVDAGRCTGCGACLQVCPYGVFGTDGSVAVVADADACRLCARCTQACRPGAITLNA